MKKTKLLFAVLTVIGAAVISALGSLVFGEKATAFAVTVTIIALAACCVTLFEASEISAIKLSLTAAMTALSVAGRAVFAAIPFFKPVSAVTILCGMFLGPLPGAICGMMSAVITGLFFGLGLWTPFQMLAWGAIGLAAGLLSGLLKKSRIALVTAGIVSGIVFSLIMDVFTVMGMGMTEGSAYIAAVVAAIPVTVTYSVSNVIFILALTPPLRRGFARVMP